MIPPFPVHISGIGMWDSDGFLDVHDAPANSNDGSSDGSVYDAVLDEYVCAQEANPGTSVSDMATAAARAALVDSGVAPTEIGCVIYAYFFIREYSAWCSAADVSRRLGLPKSTAFFDISCGCDGALIATEAAIARLALYPSLNHVMVVAADMFPRQICSKLRADNGCIYGDGAGAWVVSRGEGRYQIRSMHSDYDCELNDLIRGTYGSRQALTETSAVPLDMQAFRPFHTKAQFTQTVPFEVVRKSFVDVTMSVFETCLKDAVVAADRVTWTLFPHYGRRLAGIYATVMNVPIEKTSFKVGLRTGHLGTADPMVAVCKLRCEGGIGKGDRLLLNYQGAGISSAGMLIEVMWQ